MAEKHVEFLSERDMDMSSNTGARPKSNNIVSQEGTDDIDNMTFPELKEVLREKDNAIVALKAQINDLHLQLMEVRLQMSQSSVTVPPCVATITATTTTSTWSRSAGLPQVCVSKEPYAPGSTKLEVGPGQFMPNITSSPGFVPLPHQGVVPPGFGPLPSKGNNLEPTTPQIPRETDLITLDDSGDSSSSTTASSSSSDSSHHSDFRMMVKSLNRKSCPKPEIYSLESGKSFSRFLKSFEAYCESRFSSAHRHLWTTELGRYLEGEILQVFTAHGGSEQKYKKMKTYLETWLAGAKDRMSQGRKSQYRSAVRQSNEGLKIFAKRLEHLYRKAYPHQNIDGGDLKRRLTGALPSATVEVMERDLALIRATSNRRNTWADVLTVLEIQDDASRRGTKSHTRQLSETQTTWAGVVGKGHLAMPVQSATFTRRNYVPPGKTPSNKPGYPRRSPSGDRKMSPRNRTTSPVNSFCSYCERGGHQWNTCWRRLGRCLKCGSDKHRIADCQKSPLRTKASPKPERRIDHRPERQTMRVSARQSARESSASGSETSRKSEYSRKPRSRQARKRDRQRKSSSGSSSEKPLNQQSLV